MTDRPSDAWPFALPTDGIGLSEESLYLRFFGPNRGMASTVAGRVRLIREPRPSALPRRLR
ncbi:hypothetical protein [Actinomadura chibensis]|uniref:Uncharacterized protein n=1 Tax=Actinomadura chibensis TaxID=392828 RepID=A0A5D0NHW3_9ACTN|nr:hypothetical protein [Actinomadura chibensis]TYB43929.1 hypothetical protein FXF69_23460 [Actinomadura chibensis]